jgi:hypothetical protein
MRDRILDRAEEKWIDWAKRKLRKNAKFLISLLLVSIMLVVLSMCITGGGM